MRVRSAIAGLVLSFAVCVGYGAEKTPAQLLKQAQQAEKSGQLARAYILYSEAAVKDPTNPVLWVQA